jgi:hypothetical protein
MDEEVHGLVNYAIPPLNTRVRSSDSFIPNGSAIGDWDENAFMAKGTNQVEIIDEPGWNNEHVQPFASNNLPPLSSQIDSDFAWAPNGSNPKAQPSSFTQRQSNEIVGEPGWHSEHVQPFADHNLPPLSSQIDSDFAWVPNGSNPKAQPSSFAQAGRHGSDFNWWASETAMSPDQYPWASNAISAMSDRPSRLGDAPMPNGYLNEYK